MTIRIRVILAKTEFKEIEVDIPDNLSREKIESFAKKQVPGYEVVDIIKPTDEDYNLPLDNA